MASIYDNDGSVAFYVRKFSQRQNATDKMSHWTRSIVREWGDGSEVHDGFLNELVSDLAWKDRENTASFDYYDADYDESLSDDAGRFYYRVCIEALAQRYRFDFKYSDLYSLTKQPEAKVSNLTPALKAFGALGLGLPEAGKLVDDAFLDEKSSKASRYILLQGLYLGATLGKEQGQKIINLSDFMIESREENSTLFFWRAFGFKRLYLYEEALSCIDEAIRKLDSDEIAIHRDYSNERSSIVTCMIMRDHFQQMLKEAGITQVVSTSEIPVMRRTPPPIPPERNSRARSS